MHPLRYQIRGLRSTAVILTRRQLIMQKQTESCGTKSGLDVKVFGLKEVLQVTADHKSSGCMECVPVAKVKVMLSGIQHNTNDDDGIRQNEMILHCREEDLHTITQAIAQAKEETENSSNNNNSQLRAAVGVPLGHTHDNTLGELDQLRKLWRSGALTDAEFQTAKERLVGGK